MNTPRVKLILASASPRRAELLRAGGYRFEIIAPQIIELEPRSPDQKPAHWAEALSYFKARSVARELKDAYVLAADTVVALGERLFGKPVDIFDARRILRALSGTTHQVITGVTLLSTGNDERMIRHEITDVTMRQLADETLEDYLASGLWRGKAGAYGIQDRSDANIERIRGSYTNVVGLPTELVKSMFADCGILADVGASEDVNG